MTLIPTTPHPNWPPRKPMEGRVFAVSVRTAEDRYQRTLYLTRHAAASVAQRHLEDGHQVHVVSARAREWTVIPLDEWTAWDPAPPDRTTTPTQRSHTA